MSFFGALLRGEDQDERKVADASALTWTELSGAGGPSKTGLSVTETTALRVAAVYACCRVICEDIGKLPLKLIRERIDGSKELAREHPLYKVLFRRPNEWQTSMEWRMTMLLHALLGKAGYSYINRSEDGTVVELIPLRPSNVIARQALDWSVSYEWSDGTGKRLQLPRENVHVLHGLSWDGLSAMELLRQGQEAIGLAMAAEETQARLHGQGARPGGIVTTQAKLSETEVTRIKDQFASGYTGVSNAFKTLLLDNGLEFKPWAMSGVDGQHHETRRLQIEEICRLFRVFPSMIGATDKASTYASAEAFFGAHVIHTLMPWVELWEQAISRDLLTEDEVDQGYQAKFVLQGLLRGDAKSRAEFYESAITRGLWMTRNEARRLEDLNPLPGLDEILQPLNMQAGATKPGAKPADPGASEPDPADSADPTDPGAGD
jgi:HK97 family phage portal protein